MTKKVVVVGAGYVGVAFVQMLQKLVGSPTDLEITVLEKAPYMFHPVASLRAIVDPAWVEKLFVPYTNAFSKTSNVKLVRAIADRIEKNKVVARTIGPDDLPSNKSTDYPFDYVVIATGASYPLFRYPSGEVKVDKIKADYAKAFTKVKEASKVLVIGGGAVGCEMAGEIAAAFPDKQVTMVDRQPKLIARQSLTESFRAKLMQQLESLKIKVILGERLEERFETHCFEKKIVKTSGGTEIECDIILQCAGTRPEGANMLTDLGIPCSDESGAIKVTKSCQIDHAELKHFMVIGDANNHPTPKMAYWGAQQAQAVAKNLAKVIKGSCSIEGMPAIAAPSTEAIFVPLGPKCGAGQLPMFGGIAVGPFLVRNIKGADLFVGQTWKNNGAKAP